MSFGQRSAARDLHSFWVQPSSSRGRAGALKPRQNEPIGNAFRQMCVREFRRGPDADPIQFRRIMSPIKTALDQEEQQWAIQDSNL